MKMNRYQLYSHPLSQEFYDLMQAIEKLGGSLEQTAAVIKCGDVAEKVEKEVNRLSDKADVLSDFLEMVLVEYDGRIFQEGTPAYQMVREAKITKARVDALIPAGITNEERKK